MEPVTLLWDVEVPDSHVVVRGGRDMDREILHGNSVNVASRTRSENSGAGVPGICVGVGLEQRETLARMPYKGSWIRTSQVGLLRKHGFEIVMIQEAEQLFSAHAVLVLETASSGPDWEGWERLYELFSAAVRLED